VKNKQKLVLVLIGIAVLIAVALLTTRWIGQMLIGSVNSLQAAGEAPLPTEEVWIAPTLEPEEDFAAEEAKALSDLPDPEPAPTDEADVSAPVLESPEQLAGTADQSSIVNDDLGEADAG
jgi:hypothetical protein